VRQNENKTGKLENFLSFFTLVVLAVIGTTIFIKQFQYSPAILEGNQTISSLPERFASTEIQRPKVLTTLSFDLIPLSPPEVFGPLNLSDKINGKAGLYLSAGFKRLESQRLRPAKDSDAWIEVFIYDMGNSENAFSVFSAQQRDDAKPAGLGQFSYRTQNALYWVHGPYYIEIIASTATEENTDVMQRFAQTFIRNVKVETKSIDERNLFPLHGLDQNSIVLIADDAFGYEGFDRVYIANYNAGSAELTAFLSRRKTQQQAEHLASTYHQFLLSFGGEKQASSPLLADAKIVMILDTYEVIFSQGFYVAGVREASDIAQAINLAVMLKKRLSKNVREQ
jgi:hypothetical protein